MRNLEESINLPTRWGSFTASTIRDHGATHLMLRYGTIEPQKPVLVRMHSSCCFGDVFDSLSCDCRAQLEQALALITQEGSGIVFYLNQEGRGLGLDAKVKAIHVEQREDIDTVEAYTRLHYPLDIRSYKAVTKSLKAQGLKKIRLLTNNPTKINALKEEGLEVIRTPLITQPSEHSIRYLNAKVEKMGHLLKSSVS